ncbi:hypothetical protein [Elizabethkingia meningoseptica]|uniref:hypothetical protein n=1 Tax=Elizabethkingia meningoseptica TaxID=238 RepID=UPI00162A9A18|nr:hypothetical protein [Elizabethkingia meningoseptica]
MSEFKGTKGKWHLDGNKDDLFMVASDINDKANVVCQQPDKDACESSLKNWEANSKLISKAPEMLEMLNKCADYFLNIPNNIQAEENAEAILQLIKECTEL